MVHIQLKKLKSLEPGEYDIIISCSLFMMKEAYRTFNDYIIQFLNWFPHIPKNTFVRLYVDDSALSNPEFQKIMNLNSPHLEIIQFYCKEFFEENEPLKSKTKPLKSKVSKSIDFKSDTTIFPKGYHDGTFGSIIRLIPLYDKPEGVKYIWISDTDVPVKFMNYKHIKEMQNNNAKIFYYSKSCYNRPWSEGIRYPIGAGRIIMSSQVELNKGTLTRFLNDVLKGKYHDILMDIKKKFEGRYRSFKDIKYFPYGFDELFTNRYLYPIFKQYKRLIAFELGFVPFVRERVIEIHKKKKQYLDLYYKSWEVNIKQNEYKFLIDTTREIYQKIKTNNFKKIDDNKAQVLEICKRDYEDHFKYINPTSLEGGVSALLVKKANQE
jgi:hypothetical protein